MHHPVRYVILALVAIALFLGWEIYSGFRQEVRVAFLDVGQGDAILLSQGTHQVLIDSGRSGKVLLERLGQEMPFWDKDIDAVLLTHPDDDHIGGIADMLERYTVHAVLKTDAKASTEVFRQLEQSLHEHGVQIIPASQGMSVRFADALLETLFPLSQTMVLAEKNTNDGSIVTRFETPGSSFLLTGDLPSEFESRLHPGKIDVLKAGHHGSRYSTGDTLLDAITPREAIISVGAKNTYGHPASEVLERLKKHGVSVLRTDQSGTIVYTCPIGLDQCERTLQKK